MLSDECVYTSYSKKALSSGSLPWLKVWVSTRVHYSGLGYAAHVLRTWHYFLLSYLESLTDKIYSLLLMVF